MSRNNSVHYPGQKGDDKEKLHFEKYNEEDHQNESLLQKTKKTMKSTHMRWVFLMILNFTNLGYNFGNNFPSALSANIKDYWGLSVAQLNNLNSVYAWPNAIIPFLGGIAIDKFGIRICALVFTAVNIIGFSFWMIGCNITQYWPLITGQLIFALSGENTCIMAAAWIAKWFNKGEQGVAQAINVSFAHLWQALTPTIISGFWVDNSSMYTAMWLMLGTQLLSFAITIVACFMDKASEKEEQAIKEQETNNELQDPEEKETKKEESGHGFQFSDLKKLNLQYWLLCLLLSTGYGGFNKFQTDFQSMVKIRYSMDTILAENVQQVSLYMSIPILPLAGIFVDRVGRRCELMLGSFTLITAMYLMMLLGPTFEDGYSTAALCWVLIPQIFQGIAFGIFAAIIWSVFPLILEAKLLGTAYGIVDSAQSLIFGLFPQVLTPIFKGEDLHACEMYILFFVLINVFNILLCVWIYVNNQRGNKELTQVANKGKRTRIKSKYSNQPLTNDQ